MPNALAPRRQSYCPAVLPADVDARTTGLGTGLVDLRRDEAL